MAGIPPNFGGNRQFLADPNATGISTIVGDMAAMQLQLIHALDEVIPAGARAAINNIADHARQALAASNVSQAREQATRELRPLTRFPVNAWGINANIAPIRMHNVPSFTGSDTDTLDVVRWISRVFALAQANALTWDAATNLLVQGSSGGAADYIEQMRDEGKTIHQIVQQLEMRYGDLCTPEEARVKTNNMTRKEDEGLPEFIDRLRLMARMSCRLEDDNDARRLAIDVLVEGNIRRVLPTSVRNALEERVINRSRMGLPAFTAREIEKECLDLERRREERKSSLQEVGARLKGRIQAIETLPEILSDDDPNSSADEADVGDEGLYHLIREVKVQQNRYARAGRNVEPQKVFRKAFRSYNDKRQQQPRYPRDNPYGARQVGQGNVPQGNYQAQRGPPNRLSDDPIRRTIYELMDLANTAKGSCIQCGLEGHYMNNESCALKDKALMDRACAKCGKGLHSADDCLKVYQRQYVSQTPQPAAQANQALADLLKEI
jgi:hypothetical protein